LEREASLELDPVQHEDSVPSVYSLGPGHPSTLFVDASIPDCYTAGSVTPSKLLCPSS
jgi:hypothetical protein